MATIGIWSADIAYSLASLELPRAASARRCARVLLQKALDIELELVISFPPVGEYVFYVNNILRDFRDWFGDTARLNAVRDQFTAVIQELEARCPS